MNKEEYIKSKVLKLLSDYMKTPSWFTFKRYPEITDLNNKLISELKIDDEDLSLDLIPQIQEELHIKVPDEEWENVSTVQDMINVLVKYMR